MGFSLRSAAQHTGTTPATILRAIISGRLSADTQADGTYVIDPAALELAFPAGKPATEAMKQDTTGTGNSVGTAWLTLKRLGGFRAILGPAEGVNNHHP